VVGIALLLVISLAWGYILSGAGTGMGALETTGIDSAPMEMNGSAMGMPEWTAGYATLMLIMWWVMMVAMMLPSAAPTILLAAALNRRASRERPPYGAAGFFTTGYLVAWLFFSAAAVAAQWALQLNGQLTSMMQSSSAYLTGGLLLAAGLWQLTPIKQACLRHCRSPVRFLTRWRRPGNAGAFLLGLEHGGFCLGCCWFLMGLLFAGGVMDLYWIVGLALYVMVEKLFSHGMNFGRMAGAGLVVAGVSTLLMQLL
jgi:predicted metal-binding membrane protein